MRSFVADGNFKAIHLRQKNDNTDVWLTSGEGFMTNTARYEIHLQKATETKTVSNFLLFCFETNVNPDADLSPPSGTAERRCHP